MISWIVVYAYINLVLVMMQEKEKSSCISLVYVPLATILYLLVYELWGWFV